MVVFVRCHTTANRQQQKNTAMCKKRYRVGTCEQPSNGEISRKSTFFVVYYIMRTMSRAVAIPCLVILIIAQWWYASDMAYVRTLSGTYVFVQAGPKQHEHAEFLNQLRRKIVFFITEALKLRPDDPRLLQIKNRWSGDISEVDKFSKNIAYSIAKSDIRLCIRHPSAQTLADENDAMYVLLHELAHVATEEIGHTKTFWKNMKFLLEMAERTGVYTYDNNSDSSVCGKPLGSSPMTCVKEGQCTSELLRTKATLL